MSDNELMEAEPIGVLAQLAGSEINQAIATARRYPRDVKAVIDEAKVMATLDEETAQSMFYVLPARKGGDGRPIEGPSVRLAEVMASSWGNIRHGSRVVNQTETEIVAQGVCFDLEKNVSASIEITKSIVNKQGRKFGADMIKVASNAACATALRNAIFKVVPMAYVRSVLKEAKHAAIGDVKSLKLQRAKCIAYFVKAGVAEEQVPLIVQKQNIDDITAEDLVTLRGIATAVKEGERTLEEIIAEAIGVDDTPDVTDQTPLEEDPATQHIEQPIDIDPAWMEECLNKITTERALDIWRDEQIDTHGHQRQLIYDRCEQHRELIREQAK